jgi:hypothetical protein
MRLTPLLVFALLGVSSCMAPKYNSLRERAAAEGMCNDAPAQYLIGRKATAATASEAIEAANARYFEWIAPGSIVLTGFSPWRIRVTYDESLIITEVRCG